MNFNTIITQPALYMNSSFKRAFSLMSKKDVVCEERVLETEDNCSIDQSASILNKETHPVINEKEQIFAEIKNLLENF